MSLLCGSKLFKQKNTLFAIAHVCTDKSRTGMTETMPVPRKLRVTVLPAGSLLPLFCFYYLLESRRINLCVFERIIFVRWLGKAEIHFSGLGSAEISV